MESSARRGKQRVETPRFPLRPLAWSLALHLLALGGFATRDAADATGSSPVALLHAQLRPPPPESLPTVSPAKAAPPAVPPAPTFRVPSQSVVATRPYVAEPASGPVAATEHMAASQPAASAPAMAPATTTTTTTTTAGASVLVEAQGSRGPDAAGLREFRLVLAGEARRFRRYPEAARRAGLAGTAEVRVLVEAGGAPHRAELAQSSGHAVLDQAALDMLRQAAARAVLPESLRGQRFAVLLPVVFEVEE